MKTKTSDSLATTESLPNTLIGSCGAGTTGRSHIVVRLQVVTLTWMLIECGIGLSPLTPVPSSTCAYLAAITLLGLAMNAAFHFHWVDPVGALAAVPILCIEGRRALRDDTSPTKVFLRRGYIPK
jgi:hypothetical protein